MLTEDGAGDTRGNVVRQRAFFERIAELMRKYTNPQLTSAEVIAELIELAREVAAEGNRGARFSPPLGVDELAFFDTVATNESAVAQQGDGVLAQIARELVSVMRRDVRTDWTVRDDVRAKLRSSIRRLLVNTATRRTSSPPRSISSWSRWSRWRPAMPQSAVDEPPRQGVLTCSERTRALAAVRARGSHCVSFR